MSRILRLLANDSVLHKGFLSTCKLTCCSGDSPLSSLLPGEPPSSERRDFFWGVLKNASSVRFLVFDAIACMHYGRDFPIVEVLMKESGGAKTRFHAGRVL